MDKQFETWRRSAFKERNDKVRRLYSEGMKPNILGKRFGISTGQVKTILKEREDGQKTQVRLGPFRVDKG